MLTLDVLGNPRAQARPRAFRAGAHIRIHSPKEAWHTLVQYAAMQAAAAGAQRASGPTRIALEFRMPRVTGLPKRREVEHVKKPDLDNLCKGTVDALVPVLLATDSQVVHILAAKRYALAGESPGCRIEIVAVAMSREGTR